MRNETPVENVMRDRLHPLSSLMTAVRETGHRSNCWSAFELSVSSLVASIVDLRVFWQPGSVTIGVELP